MAGRGRPEKNQEDLQTEAIRVYVTPEMKEQLFEKKTELRMSVSKMGEIALRQWLKGDNTMTYQMTANHGDLTGALHGADLIFEQKPVNIPFSCSLDGETWEGQVRWLVNHGSHIQFNVTARGSSFTALVGQTMSGWFLSLPADGVCLDLGSPSDAFYNNEKALSCAHLNRVDGISSVYALKALSQAGYFESAD